MSVALHIGFHKTGTTSIQYWLRDHETLLAQYGLRFPRGWLRLNNHFELSLALMRLDRMTPARYRGDEWRDEGFRTDLLRQVRDDLVRHPDELTIISSEYLSYFRYDDEFEPLYALVGDAEVVAYLRRPEDFLASYGRHLTKAGVPAVSDDPHAHNYVKPDSWLVDYDTLIGHWQRWFSRVTVFDYDAETARDGSVVPSFLSHFRVPITADVDQYWLNSREDAVIPRAEGNRFSTGLRFGEVGVSQLTRP